MFAHDFTPGTAFNNRGATGLCPRGKLGMEPRAVPGAPGFHSLHFPDPQCLSLFQCQVVCAPRSRIFHQPSCAVIMLAGTGGGSRWEVPSYELSRRRCQPAPIPFPLPAMPLSGYCQGHARIGVSAVVACRMVGFLVRQRRQSSVVFLTHFELGAPSSFC